MDNNIMHIDFRSKKITTADLKLFNPKDYFKDYPYFDIYDNKKKYNNEYLYDYGYGVKKYVSVLYTIVDKNNKDTENKYVIYEEELSDEDLKELKKYCRCGICNINKWFNIKKYFICPCCIGCLDSAFPSQFNINKAREYRKNKGQWYL